MYDVLLKINQYKMQKHIRPLLTGMLAAALPLAPLASAAALKQSMG